MAVCSTPSSPLSVALPEDAATLLKFLLTLTQKQIEVRLDRASADREAAACEKDRAQTFGDAVLRREKPLLQQALEDGANRRPVDELQHEQVRLQREIRASPGSSTRSASAFRSLSYRFSALTQQQAVTVIWMVFRPGWQTCFKCRGL